MVFDISQIKEAVQKSIPLSFKTHILTHQTFVKFDKILEAFLKEMGEEKIKNQLSYCMKELAENGRKANLKRVYFQEKGLKINNYSDYKGGITNFKNDVYSNLEEYSKKLEIENLYIKIIFQANTLFFTMTVQNNVPIIGYELKRINERITHSRSFHSMEEAFSSVLDNSEGAGLGIVIMILMLKKIGLSEDSLSIIKDDEWTTIKITIPRSDILLENLDFLVNKIVTEIDVLPQFPEHINNLKRLLSDPDSNFTEIAQIVKTDPALTGDLLKLVNSAQFMLRDKIQNIDKALKMVGFRGLKNLLYSYSSQKILRRKYGEMKKLWQHSNRAAFYAYHLAKNFNMKKILDDVYVGSLLHDLGKVVIEFIHPRLLDSIKRFSIGRGISAEMFERFSIGLHHAEIGARIAEHWQFPDKLIAAIRFHHEPDQSDSSLHDLVFTIYLANSFCNFEKESLTFEQIDPNVLKYFKIYEKEQLDKLHNRLRTSFEKMQ